MIKLFRKIRQNLLNEGKTTRYFKYAFGEIVLVVIGILIALQINNWNGQRKDRIKEQIVLKQLKEDFQADLIQLEEKMATRDKVIIAAIQLLKGFDSPDEVSRENVIKNIATIGNDPTFDPIQNDLNSSENLRLISNGKLKRMLSHWSSDVVAVQEIEVIWSKIVYGQLSDVQSELGLGRDVANSFMNDLDHLWLLDKKQNPIKLDIGNSKQGALLNEILTNRKLESLIGDAITLNRSTNFQSQALHNRIKKILDFINIEINK